MNEAKSGAELLVDTRTSLRSGYKLRGPPPPIGPAERLEFMQRLAALVPRPRLHLIRFHGVLAPNAKLRREIVPVRQSKQPRPHAITRRGA